MKLLSTVIIGLRRYALLGVLLLALIAFFHFRLYHFFSLHMLKANQTLVMSWIASHYLWAVIAYIVVFALLIACTIPCATVFTLAGGFLFGNVAIVYALLSMVLGGTILFLSVRIAFGARLATRPTGWLKAFERGFRQNAFYYLLTLRLVTVLPCWISNIGAGLMNVRLLTFVSATLLGIFPSTLVYVMAGRGLDKIITQNTPLLNIILDPLVLFPLLGLAVLSILPVFYHHSLKKTQHPK